MKGYTLFIAIVCTETNAKKCSYVYSFCSMEEIEHVKKGGSLSVCHLSKMKLKAIRSKEKQAKEGELSDNAMLFTFLSLMF